MITQGMGRFADLFSLGRLIQWSGQKILLPFYHIVSDVHLPHISKLYPVRNTDQFIDDLDFFCRYYEPISMAELFQIVRGQRKISRPVFHLSFDDGLRQIYSDIAPILLKKSIPASFFINTDFINNNNLFFRYKIGLILDAIDGREHELDWRRISSIFNKWIQHVRVLSSELLLLGYRDQNMIDEIASIIGVDFCSFLNEYKPYLQTDEVKDLIHRGFMVGAHSLDHPLFKQITLEEQKRQIEGSLQMLADEFNVGERLFSFPFSDDGVRLELFEWLYEQANCDLSFGVSGLKRDHFTRHLHRIPMEKTTGSASIVLKTEYLYFLIKALIGKNHIIRH